MLSSSNLTINFPMNGTTIDIGLIIKSENSKTVITANDNEFTMNRNDISSNSAMFLHKTMLFFHRIIQYPFDNRASLLSKNIDLQLDVGGITISYISTQLLETWVGQ